MNPMMDFKQNLQKCHEYVRALEEERRKIEMFRRELPLCLEIITHALESCKQELSGTVTAPVAAATTTVTATTTTTDCQNGLSECSEQTTSDDGPVFEEFIPIKRGCFSVQGGGEDDEDNEIIELESRKISADFNDCDAKSDAVKKLDWLRSAQLWNQSPDPPTTTSDEELQKSSQPRKVSVVEVMSNGGAFHPFQNSMEIANTAAAVEAAVAPTPIPAPATSACSTAERGGDGIGKKEDAADKDGGRKSRRCWSPELHRRFLNALEQLGGPHVATPKQIRELMKVDGLTNDEVKSHLQKYRLHAKRPAPVANNNASNQPPQVVVVGGIWVPPTEYASGPATTTSTTTTTTIANAPSPSVVYAPVAAPPAGPEQQPRQTTTTAVQRHHKHPTRQSAENGVTGRCNAPAASSSARATTAC